jgi:Fe2+ or Zn2+ uptake regulation protein
MKCECGKDLFRLWFEKRRHKDLKLHSHLMAVCDDCGLTISIAVDGHVKISEEIQEWL